MCKCTLEVVWKLSGHASTSAVSVETALFLFNNFYKLTTVDFCYTINMPNKFIYSTFFRLHSQPNRKNANSVYVGVIVLYKICLATIGVCVFGTTTSVAVLFLLVGRQ